MTLTRAFASVAGSAVVCSAIGAGIGWSIGTHAPDLYRRWFDAGDAADFDPVQVGLGLGLVQGLVAGLVVGVVIVALVTWYDVTIARADDSTAGSMR